MHSIQFICKHFFSKILCSSMKISLLTLKRIERRAVINLLSNPHHVRSSVDVKPKRTNGNSHNYTKYILQTTSGRTDCSMSMAPRRHHRYGRVHPCKFSLMFLASTLIFYFELQTN